MARALIAAAPDRLIWGSDYPHLSFADKVGSVQLFNLLADWAPDEATRRRILVDNPAALFGFSRSGAGPKRRRSHQPAKGKVAGREAVAINPEDAKRRGITEGDVLRVYNARGSCLAGAVLTDAVRPGVLRLSCGAWYDPAESDDNAICVHGNANILTGDHGTSKLGPRVAG